MSGVTEIRDEYPTKPTYGLNHFAGGSLNDRKRDVMVVIVGAMGDIDTNNTS